MINCLIVDDDDITRLEIEHLIKEVPFLNMIGSASNAIDAFNYLIKGNTDLLFLDMVMPGLTGIELIDSLSEHCPKIIIMTSEKMYADDAFNHNITDFLSKPVSKDRFLKAVNKARKNHFVSNQENNNQIFIKVKSNLIKIFANDILYLASDGAHSIVHTSNAIYETAATLKALYSKLPEDKFMRVHNSFIINIDKISGIEGKTLFINKTAIPISQANIRGLLNRLNMLTRQEDITRESEVAINA